MREADRSAFATAMGALKDCYPLHRPTAEDWRRTLAAYSDRLQTLPIEAVAEACKKIPSPDYYPDFFPSAGQIVRVAGECYREQELSRRREREAHTAEADHKSDAESLRDFHRTVPATADGQEAYIREGRSRWDKLSRYWECESRKLGLHPNQATPPEVFQRRMRQLWSMWKQEAA